MNANGYAVVSGSTKSILAADKVAGDVANMGKVVAYYIDGNSKLVSTAVVADRNNSAVTVPGDLVVDPTKAKDVTKWLTANGLALSGTAADTIITDYTAATGATITAANLANIGNFTEAYVIDSNGDGKINTLVKTTKKVAEVTGAVKTKTDSDGNVTEVAPSGINADKTDRVLVLGAADMSTTLKAQYVYITKTETATNAFKYTVNIDGVASTSVVDKTVSGSAANANTPTTDKADLTESVTASNKLSLTVTADDGATVSAVAEQSAAGTVDFVVTIISEDLKTTQVCTISVTCKGFS